MNNPWLRKRYLDSPPSGPASVTDRMYDVRDCTDPAKLQAYIDWPHTQKTIRQACERRLRKLQQEQSQERWQDQCQRCQHFRRAYGGKIWRCRVQAPRILLCAEARVDGLCKFKGV